MIVIFDLDDTLFPRKNFVNNGLKNVAKFISKKNTKLKSKKVYLDLKKIYANSNIQKTFNYFLKKNNITNISENKCVSIYRYGKNDIKLYPQALKLLRKYNKKCYLISDGNKCVQRYKIKKLKIRKFFKKILLTNEYGIKFQKPSLYCFKIIKKIEKCNFENMVYIGDNPKKDFVNCNKIGIKTIRFKKGEYKDLVLKYPYEAKYQISNLKNLRKIFALFS